MAVAPAGKDGVPRNGTAVADPRAVGAAGPTHGRVLFGDASGTRTAAPAGVALLLAVLGVLAIIVGLQGLFTPDG